MRVSSGISIPHLRKELPASNEIYYSVKSADNPGTFEKDCLGDSLVRETPSIG